MIRKRAAAFLFLLVAFLASGLFIMSIAKRAPIIVTLFVQLTLGQWIGIAICVFFILGTIIVTNN